MSPFFEVICFEIQAIKRIGASYVYWYNAKYERVGHLFQGRFRSESVEGDRYLLVVLRYIHQNPESSKSRNSRRSLKIPMEQLF